MTHLHCTFLDQSLPPQCGQNLPDASAGIAFPQVGHVCPIGDPHSQQNFVKGTCLPHDGHIALAVGVCAPSCTVTFGIDALVGAAGAGPPLTGAPHDWHDVLPGATTAPQYGHFPSFFLDIIIALIAGRAFTFFTSKRMVSPLSRTMVRPFLSDVASFTEARGIAIESSLPSWLKFIKSFPVMALNIIPEEAA